MYLTLKYLMIQRKPLSSVKIIIFNSLMKIQKGKQNTKNIERQRVYNFKRLN